MSQVAGLLGTRAAGLRRSGLGARTRGPGPGFRSRSWGARVTPWARDQTTIVTFTVKFYYNEVFAQSTPDIEGWVDSSLAMLNQAMVNSLVPVRVRKFATEMAMIPEFRN